MEKAEMVMSGVLTVLLVPLLILLLASFRIYVLPTRAAELEPEYGEPYPLLGVNTATFTIPFPIDWNPKNNTVFQTTPEIWIKVSDPSGIRLARVTIDKKLVYELQLVSGNSTEGVWKANIKPLQAGKHVLTFYVENNCPGLRVGAEIGPLYFTVKHNP
jgi:hypothetical protein